MKYLIIRFSSLGDVVISTSVVNAIQQELEQSEIYFLTKSSFAPLLQNIIPTENIIEYDGSILNAVNNIKAINPDYIIDLHRNNRSMLISLLSGIKTIKTNKRNISRRLVVSSIKKNRKKNSIVSDHFTNLHIISSDKEYLPIIRVSETEKNRVIKYNITKNSILIHPGAKWKLKEWGIEHFHKLGQLLEKHGFAPVYFSEEKIGTFQNIHGLNIRELCSVISQCALFIGNDSGPTHIAAALGVPTMSIFGPTHPCLGFEPSGSNAIVIQNEMPCSPCTLHGNRKCKFTGKNTGKCMLELLPETVYKKALELL